MNPFGVHAHSIELHNDELLVAAQRDRRIKIGSLKTTPSVMTGLMGSTLKIAIDDGTSVALRGARHSDAISFRETVQSNWIAHNTARFEKERSTIDDILGVIAKLSESSRYPSAYLFSPTLERAKALNSELLTKLPEEAMEGDVLGQIQMIR